MSRRTRRSPPLLSGTAGFWAGMGCVRDEELLLLVLDGTFDDDDLVRDPGLGVDGGVLGGHLVGDGCVGRFHGTGVISGHRGLVGDGSGGGRLGLLGLGDGRLLRGHGLQHQLDDGHGGVVALAIADLRDAGVTTLAVGDGGRDVREQLVDDPLAADDGEDATAGRQVTLLRERDETLGVGAEALGLRHRGGDALVLEQ
ncbi:hypothetical protein AC792_03280 [Arthrobacter sp. RIT-PI-e]|nr:hypothetical protein AC792_03280 [Arthrobacter sp. RIT-PI-e]